MNIRRPWLLLALLFFASVVVGFAVPTTLAYITVQSDSLVNTFDAPYFTPESASVTINIHKVVQNTGSQSISPEGFRFKLESATSHESFTLVSGKDGLATITLPFSDADLGKTHSYRLYEINDGLPNVTYDTTVHTVNIALSVNAQNQLVAQTYVDNQPVEQAAVVFENTYSAGVIPPLTGDDTPLLLYVTLMILSGAGILLCGKRFGFNR